MSESVQLPCSRCGRLVAVAVQSRMGLPVCDACRVGSRVRGAFLVQKAGASLSLDRATVLAKLATGELRDTDWIAVEGEAALPIAAHPAFRDHILAGGSPPAAPTAPRRSFRVPRVAGPLLGGAVVVVVVAAAFQFARPAVTAFLAPAPVPVVATPAPASIPGPVAELVARVGPVGEPGNLLLARAWAARLAGTPEGMAAATRATEKAVARNPDDAEALTLLAVLLAESGGDPGLVDALHQHARSVAPGSIAVARSSAELALVQGRTEDARALAPRCLDLDQAYLPCLDLADQVAPGSAADRLPATLALSERWPENRRLQRRAALVAFEAGAGDAEQRLADARKMLPGDAALGSALARLRFRHGDVAGSRDLVRSLGTGGPPELVLRFAGESIAAADADAADRWLTPLAAATDLSGVTQSELLLRRAQAAVVRLRAAPGDEPLRARAMEVTKAALTVDRSSPAHVQARLLACLVTHDFSGGQRAWESVEMKESAQRDIARTWLARVALDLEQQLPREAGVAMESARKADPKLREAYLWEARILLSAQDGAGALRTLRSAVLAVDGTDARRDPVARTLPVPVDAAQLAQSLVALVGNESQQQDNLVLGMAVLDWLGGETDRALGRVSGAVGRSSDADLHALQARLLLRKGDAPSALAAVARAVELKPREPAYALLHADILVAVGRDAEAAAALKIVWSSGGGGSLHHRLLATLAMRGGDPVAALKSAVAAVAADPSDLDARSLHEKLAAGR